MGLKNMLQDLKKSNFANEELVKLEKKTDELFRKVNNKDYNSDIDFVKNEVEFILLERKTIFMFTKEFDKIEKKDGILSKIDKILNIIKKEGGNDKNHIIEIIIDLDHSYNFNTENVKEEYTKVIETFDLIEEILKLKEIHFDYNYMNKYEFNISDRQYISFLNCIKYISKNNIKESIHALREFIENYRMSMNEPFWICEKVFIKSMIYGIRENIKSLQ